MKIGKVLSIKYILSFLLSVIILLLCTYCGNDDSDTSNHGTTTVINMEYMSTPDKIEGASQEYNTTNIAADNTYETYKCNNYKELLTIVRKQMLSRNMAFVVEYSGGSEDLSLDSFYSFLNSIFNYDDPNTSNDYDYLKLNLTKAQLMVNKLNGVMQFTFLFNYLTTMEQELTVDKNTKDILDNLNVYKDDDYHKIAVVDNYIVDHVKYDYTYSNKSAYDALTKGSAICRGYVLLAYKMFDGLGIPVRIITGKGNGEPHTWNIIRLDDKWYNIDITWDDTTHSDNFYLKNEKDFVLHKSDPEFTTKDFLKAYPIADTSYSVDRAVNPR